MIFRKDINSLRAIAVIAVIVFHYNHSWLPGGFSGVDVFFVISGYLMTGIIFRRIEGGRFSIVKFYIDRAKRILPSIVFLCLTLLIFGLFYIEPLGYKELGKHVLSSISFISNIIYWSESGYFDSTSQGKWLLHTWSLSVEWQFYILYPLFILIMKSFFSLDGIKKIICICALICYLFSIMATHSWPSASYYFLPTRAWEMLLGGVAYLYPCQFSEKTKKILGFIGLLFLVLTFFYISDKELWPGYLALIPALGTFMMIQARQDNSIIANNNFFQKIGVMSYSIYLWHWVVLVFKNKFGLDFSIYIYLFIVFVVSYLSHVFVERVRLFVLLPLFFVTVMLSAVVYMTDGVESRVSSDKLKLNKKEFHAKYYGGRGYPSGKVFYRNAGRNNYDILFLGDSYGLQYSKRLDEAGIRFAGLFRHGCVIFPNYSRFLNGEEYIPCSDMYQLLKNEIEGNRKALFIAHSWNGYRDRLVKKGGENVEVFNEDEYNVILESELEFMISEFGLDRKYFILGVAQPSEYNVFECLSRNELPGYNFFGYKVNKDCHKFQEYKVNNVNAMLYDFSEKFENVFFINPNDFLCYDEQCLLIEDGELIYSDQYHLSIYGARIVVDGFMKNVFAKMKN